MQNNELQAERERLERLVLTFVHQFTSLENDLAHVLHHVLSYPNTDSDSRVPYEIYFAPDSFGARLSIVDAAVTQWLTEHALNGIDVLQEWQYIASRLNTVRKARNFIAHWCVTPSVGATPFRLAPPAHDPEHWDKRKEGKTVGKSSDDLVLDNRVAAAVTAAVQQMRMAIEAHQREPDLRARVAALATSRAELQQLLGAA